MKRYRVPIIIACLLVSLIFLCSYTLSRMETDAWRLLAQAENVAGLLAQENWPQALIQEADLIRDWENTRKTWSLFTDHQLLDKVSESLRRLHIYLSAQDATEARLELSTILYHLQHLPGKERLTLANFF